MLPPSYDAGIEMIFGQVRWAMPSSPLFASSERSSMHSSQARDLAVPECSQWPLVVVLAYHDTLLTGFYTGLGSSHPAQTIFAYPWRPSFWNTVREADNDE